MSCRSGSSICTSSTVVLITVSAVELHAHKQCLDVLRLAGLCADKAVECKLGILGLNLDRSSGYLDSGCSQFSSVSTAHSRDSAFKQPKPFSKSILTTQECDSLSLDVI